MSTDQALGWIAHGHRTNAREPWCRLTTAQKIAQLRSNMKKFDIHAPPDPNSDGIFHVHLRTSSVAPSQVDSLTVEAS